MTETLFFLTDLTVLRVQGDKAAAFLNGQLTHSIADLPVGRGHYNLWLTLKGKVVADADVLNFGTHFDVVTQTRFQEAFLNHLLRLAPLSRCTVTHAASLKVWHVWGRDPAANQTLAPGETRLEATDGVARTLYRSDRLGQWGLDVFAESEVADKVQAQLVASGAREVPASEAEAWRIRNGVARVGVDVTEANLPQEGRLDRALHFKKGCYLGQEVIARLHYRGHVNKLLGHFTLAGEAPKPGAAILDADGKSVGTVTSAARDPQNGMAFVLGYVPLTLWNSETELKVAGQTLLRMRAPVEAGA